jgi:hypothetical protein
MDYQWREDERANRLHCFGPQPDSRQDDKVLPGAVALCGWVFDGVPAAGLRSVSEWRAIQGDRSICHDCNVRWERSHGVVQP